MFLNLDRYFLASFELNFAVAGLVRILLTLYGIRYDFRIKQANSDEPRYTDVDYYVFSDAASYTYKVSYS